MEDHKVKDPKFSRFFQSLCDKIKQVSMVVMTPEIDDMEDDLNIKN